MRYRSFSGKMNNGIKLMTREQVHHSVSIQQIDLDEFRAWINCFLKARYKIVHDHDFVALAYQNLGYNTSNVASATRNKYLHKLKSH
jgi:truncated hemoglobin YjbI